MEGRRVMGDAASVSPTTSRLAQPFVRPASRGTLPGALTVSSAPDTIDMKLREVIRLIESNGWVQVRQRGSHRQFKHATRPGTVTVAGKNNQDLPPGTLNSVLKQAGIKNP
jgi:predicted RNA binding protein YcfA (HicA-like mRNA interferase family)